MCGIAGFVRHSAGGAGPGRSGTTHRLHAQVARAMGRALAHRGPDGERVHVDARVGLAHRRLAIIDVEGGAQPLSNEDGSVWVSYNGEVYNHVVLRRELEARGHRFRTRSDTEAIVHAYEEWGPACTERLRGMFAFAVWDGRQNTLLLARDRLGKKPLYYVHGPEGLAFASEAKALFVRELELVDLVADTRLDPEALDVYLALRYVPGTRTLWRGIEKLAPGHTLIVRDGTVSLRAFWDVPVEEWGGDRRGEAELADELAARLDEAVASRLMSEVPLGAFLSGGLDSSAVVTSIAKTAGPGLRTYSIGYGDREGQKESELPYAKRVAERAGTVHREVVLEAGELAALLPEVIHALDEPVADPAAIPLYKLAREARREVTVVLSGEGADEVLAGYGAYPRGMWIDWLTHRLPLWELFAQPALRAAHRHVVDPRLRRLLSQAELPLEHRYTGISRALDDDERRRLGLGPAVRARQWLAPYHVRTRGLPALARMLYLDLKTWLPDDLLIKADKVTMAHGLELRVPLLDHTFLEFCWRLPARLKVRRGVGKWLLRRAVAQRVPREILERPKKGFPVPVAAWLRGPLYGLVHDLLVGAGAATASYFPRDAVTRLIDQHRAGARHEDALYALLVLELWHRNVQKAGASAFAA